MINARSRNTPLAPVRSAPDPSVLFEAEVANGSLLEKMATYVGILVASLFFSGWLVLRSLRLVRHGGEPVRDLFGPMGEP